MSRLIPRDTDEHLLRSIDTLFAFGSCRLCSGTFPSDNREGHLNYHHELFEQYAPGRRKLERHVLGEEEKLGWRLILETPGMPSLTVQRLRRHASLYGIEGVRECATADGINLEPEKREPELPSSVRRRRKRRIATPEGVR